MSEDSLTYLISLAPIINDTKKLFMLSKLSTDDLAKVSEFLPIMSSNEIEEYFSKLSLISN